MWRSPAQLHYTKRTAHNGQCRALHGATAAALLLRLVVLDNVQQYWPAAAFPGWLQYRQSFPHMLGDGCHKFKP